jgi:hypothetical protein
MKSFHIEINESWGSRFYQKLRIKRAKMFLRMKSGIKNIHWTFCCCAGAKKKGWCCFQEITGRDFEVGNSSLVLNDIVFFSAFFGRSFNDEHLQPKILQFILLTSSCMNAMDLCFLIHGEVLR